MIIVEYNRKKIIQIMPADGWAAAYREHYCDKVDYMYCPLVCWALIQEPDGTKSIRGIDCDSTGSPAPGYDPLAFSDEESNFCGYEKFKSDGTFYELPHADDLSDK